MRPLETDSACGRRPGVVHAFCPNAYFTSALIFAAVSLVLSGETIDATNLLLNGLSVAFVSKLDETAARTEDGSRLVVLTSQSHQLGKMHWDQGFLNSQRDYDP